MTTVLIRNVRMMQDKELKLGGLLLRNGRIDSVVLFAGVFGNESYQDEQGSYSVQVEDGQDERIVDNVEIPRKKPLSIELHNKRDDASEVDLMFVVDTTGSMGMS